MPSEFMRVGSDREDRPSNLTDLLSLPTHQFIEETYLVLRDQLPNDEEREHDAHRLRMGFGRTTILGDVRASADQPEHVERMGHHSDDGSFLDFIFCRYFAHDPEPDMRERLLGLLAGGTSREDVRDLVARYKDPRLGVGLWAEIAEWLHVQTSGKRGVLGWRSRARKRRRQRNQELEILCAQRHADDQRIIALIDQSAASVKCELETAIVAASRSAGAPSQLAGMSTLTSSSTLTSKSSLAKVNPAALSPAARVVLARLRNLASIAPMEGNI